MHRKNYINTFNLLFIGSVLAALIGTETGWAAEKSAVAPTRSEEPLESFCFVAPESEKLTAALGFEYVEDDARPNGGKLMVSGFGFGTVTTAEGQSWGFLRDYQGVRDGNRLVLEEHVTVEGDVQKRKVEWTIKGNFLETGKVTYKRYDCAPLEKEHLRLITGR